MSEVFLIGGVTFGADAEVLLEPLLKRIGVKADWVDGLHCFGEDNAGQLPLKNSFPAADAHIWPQGQSVPLFLVKALCRSAADGENRLILAEETHGKSLSLLLLASTELIGQHNLMPEATFSSFVSVGGTQADLPGGLIELYKKIAREGLLPSDFKMTSLMAYNENAVSKLREAWLGILPEEGLHAEKQGVVLQINHLCGELSPSEKVLLISLEANHTLSALVVEKI